MIQELKNYFLENKDRIIQEYKTFLSFPSISANPEYLPKTKACASWLRDKLEALQLKALHGKVSLWELENRPPVVYAFFKSPIKDAKTVLIYNHYDVQPVDPLDEWKSDPFQANIENEKVFARGASDNKGHCLFMILALEYFIQKKELPCNIKVLIEGEEESEAHVLPFFLEEKKELLSSDYAMIVDLGMQDKETPAITLGTRGMSALTIHLQGTNSDLHSGAHGGLAFNPLHALVSLLSSCRNDEGFITIPGFYDDVAMPSKEEMKHLFLDFDEQEYEKEFSQKPTGGEKGFTPKERNWLRPTFEINGIHGGYGGVGCKTVIPKEALAKITCRLVPHQDPEKIAKKIKDFLLSKTPEGVHVDITIHKGGGKAFRTNSSSFAISCLKKALKEVFHKEPLFILEGASIPIAPKLHDATKGEMLLWGLGLKTDSIHAPNEHFDLNRLEKGFLTAALTIDFLSGNRK